MNRLNKLIVPLQVGFFLLVSSFVSEAGASWKLICNGTPAPDPIDNKGSLGNCGDGLHPVWIQDSPFDVLTLDQDAISLIMIGTMAFYVSGLFFGAIMRLFQRFIAR